MKEDFSFDKALAIIREEYVHVKDRGGNDIINHFLHVADALRTKGYSNLNQVVGLLHDLPEDFPYYTESVLRDLIGLPPSAVKSLLLLKYSPNNDFIQCRTKFFVDGGMSETSARYEAMVEDYIEYVTNLSSDEMAATTKLADMENNSDLSRLRPKDLGKTHTTFLSKKYEKGIALLKSKGWR